MKSVARSIVATEEIARLEPALAPHLPRGTRNIRNVWTVTTASFAGAHFATSPQSLIEPCILAGSSPDSTVLDPFGGPGTTGLVTRRLGRNAILCELNHDFAEIATSRIRAECGVVEGTAQPKPPADCSIS